MNDSINSGSDSNKQGGSCSPLECCDWKSISERVKAVLTDPKNVWPTIKAENKSIKEIYLTYVIPLAVIGALCGLLGSIIFGFGAGFVGAIVGTVVQLAVMLGLMFVNAMIYKTLAPHFGGSTDETSAFKLVAYGGTASMVGAFLTIFPPLALLMILFAVYGLYTVYQGIPTMTGVTEKRVVYFVVCLIASIIVGIVVGGAITAVLGLTAAGVRAF